MEPGESSNLLANLWQLVGSLLVAILSGWNTTQQVQINALKSRQDSLRDILATKEDIADLREDMNLRHRENLESARALVDRIDRLTDGGKH